MAPSVRVFDDGAWISVDGDRVVGVAEVWTLSGHDFCDCERCEFLVEAFADATSVRVSDRPRANVVARPIGRCLTCGSAGDTGPLVVGQVVGDTFVPATPPFPHDPE